MSTKHTPGPWTFSRWDEGGYTRFYIAQQEGAPYTPDYSDVASMVSETVSGERIAVQEANARLIAAAPELLDALILLEQEMLLSGNAGSEDYGWKPAIEKTRAAIAKAMGAA